MPGCLAASPGSSATDQMEVAEAPLSAAPRASPVDIRRFRVYTHKTAKAMTNEPGNHATTGSRHAGAPHQVDQQCPASG